MDFSNLIITALGLQGVIIEKFEFEHNKLSLKYLPDRIEPLAAVIIVGLRLAMFMSGKSDLCERHHLEHFCMWS